MQRRKFSREYKLEAVKLVRERGSAFRWPPAIWMFMRMSFASGSGNSVRTRRRRFLVTDR